MGKMTNENISTMVNLLEGFIKEYGDDVTVITSVGDIIGFANRIKNTRVIETTQLINAINDCRFNLI